jgi:hypothetical protein
LTRVVCDPIPGASRPETQYGWPSRPIQLKAFLIEREHAWTSSLACSSHFLVVILVLYLVNMLPIDGRAKQIVRVIVIILGVISLLKYLAVF